MFSKPHREVDRAARTIVDLINARPISPRQNEIAAIIETIVVEPLLHPYGRAELPNCGDLDKEYGPLISR